MFPLVETKERSFTKMEDLRDVIASEKRRFYEVLSCEISISQDGRLRAGRFEGPMTRSALFGIFNTLGIPENFVIDVCPIDLVVTIVDRLVHEQKIQVVVQVVDGVATAVMPADRQSINQDVLIDRLGVKRPIQEAILAGQFLRITLVDTSPNELLPNDNFYIGWELTNGEDGWHSTELWRFVLRQICSNGMVGFDKIAVFRRTHSSREPVLKSLEGLVHFIESTIRPLELEPAIKWAAGRQLGNEHKIVVDYLSQRLEGDATRLSLNAITPDSSWYELLNIVTSIARVHTLEVRRQYEVEGGVILNWFLRQGRGRPPWQRVPCKVCEYWQDD